MIKLFGEYYYIDFEELDDFLLLDKDAKDKVSTTKTTKVFDESAQMANSKTVEVAEHIKHKEINAVKFELIRNFISDLGDEPNEEDYGLGSNNLTKTSVRFKLAFNTLLVYGILKKMD